MSQPDPWVEVIRNDAVLLQTATHDNTMSAVINESVVSVISAMDEWDFVVYDEDLSGSEEMDRFTTEFTVDLLRGESLVGEGNRSNLYVTITSNE